MNFNSLEIIDVSLKSIKNKYIDRITCAKVFRYSVAQLRVLEKYDRAQEVVGHDDHEHLRTYALERFSLEIIKTLSMYKQGIKRSWSL